MFSILLRIPSNSLPSNKLVFVQYLFALAVVEACRKGAILGDQGRHIRIKWPNDIYLTSDNPDAEKRKVGGVLVNTSFSSGTISIVIG